MEGAATTQRAYSWRSVSLHGSVVDAAEFSEIELEDAPWQGRFSLQRTDDLVIPGQPDVIQMANDRINSDFSR